MITDPKIELDCPYCDASIYQTVSWFKKAYSTCPDCDMGLAEGQFSAVIAQFEQEMAANIEEMINGEASSNCCGKKSACGD